MPRDFLGGDRLHEIERLNAPCLGLNRSESVVKHGRRVCFERRRLRLSVTTEGSL